MHSKDRIILFLLKFVLSVQSSHVGITCPPIQSPVNGFITFSDGSVASSVFQFLTNVTYVCDTGYGLSGGDRVRTCVGSVEGPGEWSGTAPTCEGMQAYNVLLPRWYALVLLV